MTFAACLSHQPMHVFGVGYVCARCKVSVPSPVFASDSVTFSPSISTETQKQLDDIDANIRAAHARKHDTFLD